MRSPGPPNLTMSWQASQVPQLLSGLGRAAEDGPGWGDRRAGEDGPGWGDRRAAEDGTGWGVWRGVRFPLTSVSLALAPLGKFCNREMKHLVKC